jgi:hypothetical protein
MGTIIRFENGNLAQFFDGVRSNSKTRECIIDILKNADFKEGGLKSRSGEIYVSLQCCW